MSSVRTLGGEGRVRGGHRTGSRLQSFMDGNLEGQSVHPFGELAGIELVPLSFVRDSSALLAV